MMLQGTYLGTHELGQQRLDKLKVHPDFTTVSFGASFSAKKITVAKFKNHSHMGYCLDVGSSESWFMNLTLHAVTKDVILIHVFEDKVIKSHVEIQSET